MTSYVFCCAGKPGGWNESNVAMISFKNLTRGQQSVSGHVVLNLRLCVVCVYQTRNN